MRKHGGMRPHDIAVLLKIISLGNVGWRVVDLAAALFLSQSEISESLNRCKIARFVDHSKRVVHRGALLEFLKYGLRYVFPVEPGSLVRGIPTAHSAKPLSSFIRSEADVYVWPFDMGMVRGQAIEPLYENAAKAAFEDSKLYELLALTDALRVGKSREYSLAVKELTRRIGNGGKSPYYDA